MQVLRLHARLYSIELTEGEVEQTSIGVYKATLFYVEHTLTVHIALF